MRIIVTRGAGDKLAPETLIDPLCTTVGIGTEKGKAYIYDVGYNKRMYELTFPYQGPIYPTNLVAVHDNTLGESFVARVVHHSINIRTIDGAVLIESNVIAERKEDIL